MLARFDLDVAPFRRLSFPEIRRPSNVMLATCPADEPPHEVRWMNRPTTCGSRNHRVPRPSHTRDESVRYVAVIDARVHGHPVWMLQTSARGSSAG